MKLSFEIIFEIFEVQIGMTAIEFELLSPIQRCNSKGFLVFYRENVSVSASFDTIF